MKKVVTLSIIFFATYCASELSAVTVVAVPLSEAPGKIQVRPVVGLQFQEEQGSVPYSFYYPYDYGYYYPETYGYTKNTGQESRECYTRFEDGTIFYECD
ncbi:hypothetical protein CpB1062 [Chlamydia pneumoniae TW-183]|uniref:Lipoprotein n=2 Tax=Chlamydia pneumoniae TaxID=83558 RepID=Q9Z6N6_CHLPN|nr:hypothetical protein [Chlamydia pneumoniae]AAD19160.1 hypothetical protein CPn_1023 [Chlamydia pneumoniae CWL029]AAF38622.1 hypothetical protein CP_0829 [Chlamydia pneumoniae AR39]AAP98991.1 hypothetical protein CpB1062 [Chlamydia pneumoniae TW-183]ACZ32926.1 conserved hypothetical protein [Chlamydia pneumoniae LPCoLN]CRI33566.1 Uncharacterized protein BN1224_Wien1_A_10730 [Chlamydia pneumoniae]